jgi:peptidoglycan pentaglycine glycine transferase (the first glycine)
MTESLEPRAEPAPSDVRCYCAPTLDPGILARWHDFDVTVPWAHFRQDPAWAPIESDAHTGGARQAYYFWAQRDGAICLTGIGVRRRLPVPGRVFLEFQKGPTFRDEAAFDAWLAWIKDALGGEVARLRVSPALPLDAGGDDVETLLERRGFRRRRTLGGWASLLVDIGRTDDEIFGGFRSATRRSIRKSQRLGIEVLEEDTPEGWSVLASLETDLARRAAIQATDARKIDLVSTQWLRGGTGGSVLVARHGDEPLAAALLVVHQGNAHIPLIPSSRRHRDMPASHLLVWEAMRWARDHGCTTFDFSGYSLVAQPGDQLWGINQFKRGFAGADAVTKSVAIHEWVVSPAVVAAAAAVRRAQSWRRARHDGSSG